VHVFAAYFNRNGLAESVVDVGDDNARTLTGESASHLGADATRSTGNESALTSELSRHNSSNSVC
jgi:hypothetical protein